MMTDRYRQTIALFLLVGVLLLLPAAGLAYGGPGSVVSGIGALLAAVAAVGAALFGFLWFPLKRLYRSARGSRADEVEGERDT